jgi:hypothetical protein
MTGPELFTEALRLREQAAEWMDADTGWRGTLTTDERIVRRTADLTDAQVCATLALTAATAQAAIEHMDQEEFLAWDKVCGGPS